MEILTLNSRMRKWYPHIDPARRPLCYKAFNDPPRETICSYCPTFKTLQDGTLHEAMTETPLGEDIRNFRIISTPIKDENGKVIAAIEMVEDMTESFRLQERLAESEKKYRTIFETTASGTMIVDADTTISLVNRAFEERIGYMKTKKTAISRIENHAEDIKLSTLDRVAKALGKRLQVHIA
jgi:PAS domain-containing protein